MRRSREEFGGWKKEPVNIDVEELLGATPRSLIVMVDGVKFFVGKSIIDNLDELEAQLDSKEKDDKIVLTVPRWCAHNNGWLDDED